MEDDRIHGVKKSLGFFLGLIWSFGIPRPGVRYVWKITYPLILCLLYFAMYGFLLSQQIAKMFQSGSEDAGIFLPARLIACIYTFTITIVWSTKGEDTVQKTILNLAKVDLILRDFRITKKDLSLRQGQVLWIGLFFLWLGTETAADVILLYNQPRKSLPTMVTFHHIVARICSVICRLQLVTLDIFFSAIVLAISDRFHRVNIALYETTTDYDNATKNSSFDKREKSIVVRNCGLRTTEPRLEKLIVDLDALYEIHTKLRDVTERFSQVFSFSLLSALLTGLISSLGDALRFATLVHGKFYTNDVILIRGFIFLYNTVSSWMLIRSCSCLVVQANKSGVLLHRTNAFGLTFYKKLRELSMKHHQEKLTIIAGGVLPVDYSWLKLVLFTVTAYAIFILQ